MADLKSHPPMSWEVNRTPQDSARKKVSVLLRRLSSGSGLFMNIFDTSFRIFTRSDTNVEPETLSVFALIHVFLVRTLCAAQVGSIDIF